MSFRLPNALRVCTLHHFLPTWTVLLCLSIAGCDAANVAAPFGPRDSLSGSGGGGGGHGSTSTESGGGGDPIDFGSGNDAGLDDDAACVSSSVEADLIPLDILLLVDRSGSMYGENWNGASNAITQFVMDPASAGIHAGLLYFPVDNPSDGKMCNYEHYDTPVIPIAELPQNATPIIQSIAAENPNGGGTPMYGALRGALAYATAYQDSHPAHKVIVLLASDGDPNSCSQLEDQIPTIADLAEKAYNYNGVETYVIAISGATVTNLNQIAAKGGSGAAYDVTADISQFSQKMAEIRAAALSCEFLIPEAPQGETLEYDKVAVKYSSGSLPPEEFPYVLGAGNCGVKAGWYYDDIVAPTKIVLCPASCDLVKGDVDAKVGVYFGCTPTIR